MRSTCGSEGVLLAGHRVIVASLLPARVCMFEPILQIIGDNFVLGHVCTSMAYVHTYCSMLALCCHWCYSSLSLLPSSPPLVSSSSTVPPFFFPSLPSPPSLVLSSAIPPFLFLSLPCSFFLSLPSFFLSLPSFFPSLPSFFPSPPSLPQPQYVH